MTKLSLSLDGERQIKITRRLKAPPDFAFRAHTEGELMMKWLSGTRGYSLTIEELESRDDGPFSYRFDNADGSHSFHIRGRFLELERPRRILHVETMYLPDPTPENRIETLFEPDGDGTLMRMTMSLPDAATRQAMIDSGMADGMEESYQVLDGLVPA